MITGKPYKNIKPQENLNRTETHLLQPGCNCDPHSRTAWVDLPGIPSQTSRPRDSLAVASMQVDIIGLACFIWVHQLNRRYNKSLQLCRLCNSQVKFTKESVSGHLRLTHGTDLATYEQCYMQDEDWPDQQMETAIR